MDLKIVNEERNDLLHRRELRIVLDGFSGTPSRKDVAKAIVAKLGTNEDHFVINRIRQEFGKNGFVCDAKVYDSPENMKKYEPKYYFERGKPKEVKEEKKTGEAK